VENGEEWSALCEWWITGSKVWRVERGD
jgi:hypothetical protein